MLSGKYSKYKKVFYNVPSSETFGVAISEI
jgi:hypothetical protein